MCKPIRLTFEMRKPIRLTFEMCKPIRLTLKCVKPIRLVFEDLPSGVMTCTAVDITGSVYCKSSG